MRLATQRHPIRERLYARTPDEGAPWPACCSTRPPLTPKARSAGSSRLALPTARRPDRQRVERASICTSDPFCATHLPNGTPTGGVEGDGSLHGAACHVCLFLPETSCDHANQYLDRTFVVPTLVDGQDQAFLG